MTESRKIMADNLNQLLRLAQISQSELAMRLNVSKTAVSSWCSGAKAPRMDKVDEMARIFGVSSASFFQEGEPEVVVTDAGGEQLRRLYYQLNRKGQEKLIDYALDLLNNPNYHGTDVSE